MAALQALHDAASERHGIAMADDSVGEEDRGGLFDVGVAREQQEGGAEKSFDIAYGALGIDGHGHRIVMGFEPVFPQKRPHLASDIPVPASIIEIHPDRHHHRIAFAERSGVLRRVPRDLHGRPLQRPAHTRPIPVQKHEIRIPLEIVICKPDIRRQDKGSMAQIDNTRLRILAAHGIGGGMVQQFSMIGKKAGVRIRPDEIQDTPGGRMTNVALHGTYRVQIPGHHGFRFEPGKVSLDMRDHRKSQKDGDGHQQ